MKIILLHDVAKVGRKYETKNIADGHALNLLIPKGLAIVATPAAIKRVEKMKAEDTVNRKIQEDLLLLNLKAIDGQTIELSEKTNDKGHLFAGVHKNEIIAAMKAQKHIDLLPEFIELDKPIKEAGERVVDIKVQDKTAKLKVVIKPVA